MNKVKFSLKFKILSGVIILLLLCTSFNLIYSYQLFIDDKTSYIYENGLKRVDNITDQLKFKTEELKTKSHINSELVQKPDLDKEFFFNENKETVFYGQAQADGVKLKLESAELNHVAFSETEKKLHVSQATIQQFIENKYRLQKVNEAEDVWFFRVNDSPPLALCYYRKSATGSFYYSVSSLEKLFSFFTNDNLYKNSLVFLSNDKELKSNAELLSKMSPGAIKSGTLKYSKDNTDFLLSYLFYSKSILITSAIESELAFGISKYLILKTVLFACFLLGITLIAGIYFSSSLTTPLKILTNKANSFADGNFDDLTSIETTDEIKILGDAFNLMGKEISSLLDTKEQLIKRLEDYNRNLEQTVADRTSELRNANIFLELVMNSLDQGLLVFNRQLECHSMHTQACEPIFGINPHQKNVLDILGINSEDERNQISQWAELTFSEMIPFESAVGLGPRNKITGKDFNDPDFKYIQIDYYPMRKGEQIDNIVMVATDKTLEMQAIEKSKENEIYVSMLLKIIKNKYQFQSFINEVNEIFETLQGVYDQQTNILNFPQAMMMFHTLSGGFGMYNLAKFQALARGYESEITEVKDNCPDPSEYAKILNEHIDTLKSGFDSFKKELDSTIGTKFANGVDIIEIPREKIRELKELVVETNNKKLIDEFMDGFYKESIGDFFKAYDDLCLSVALKINKQFDGIQFYNYDLKIDPEPFKEFFNTLVHVFRNSMDHGLEDPYTRQNIGKTAVGHIGVAFEILKSEESSQLIITIQDDGAGLNVERIRAKWQSLNPDTDVSELSKEELYFKIFDPFFSTKDEVTFLSGRGVGMSAVKEVVEKLGGSIEIESHAGKGTIFTFKVPIDESY